MTLIDYDNPNIKPIPLKAIQLPATFDGLSSLKDGSFNLKFNTNEISGDQFAILKEYLQKFGWLLFKPSDESFVQSEVPEYDPALHDEKKSPSERLRAVLFLRWKNTAPETRGDWDAFYKQRIEMYINHEKEKLPPQ